MQSRNLHPWNVTPREAIHIQKKLRHKVLTNGRPLQIRTVAGADISWAADGWGYGGVIVFSYPDLKEVERQHFCGKAPFPYVPGLLSFREIPLLLKVFEEVHTEPDVIFVDGQGIAHPRRMGIASHLGLVLNKPTIGCAKSLLIGEYREPRKKRGGFSSLMDGGEKVGAALRTRAESNPIFVSVGHLIGLEESIRLVMDCSDGYRIPKPTREADRFVGQLAQKG
ncbi:MAG: endonuclease V [Elusimicrobia bacterium]|nr:endonuclease V [Elusimicrobiota bacterium]